MTANRLTHPLAYGFYLLLAVVMTYPLITQMSDVFIGAPESDAYEYARHTWWYTYAPSHGEPLFHHTYLAHPDGLPALWLWAIPLQSFPAALYALVLPLPVAYNLMVLMRLALNGWAAFFLVRRLLDGTHFDTPLTAHPTPAALLAGAVFTLYPAVQGQLFGSHAGIIALWGVPLYADVLYRLRRHRRPRDFLLAGAFFTASILGSNLMLIFAALPVTAYFVVARLLRREWAWLRRVLIAAAVGLALSAVFFIPAGYEQATSAAAVDPGGAGRFSADALSIVTPSFLNPLFAGLDYPRRVLGTNIVEGTGYVGIIASLLAMLAVWRVRAARGWLLFALALWVISLGPLLKVLDTPLTFATDELVSYIPLPFALFSYLPVVDTIRTPGRANLTIGLAVAVMAGYGFMWATMRLRRAPVMWAAAFALIAAVTVEYQLVWGFPAVTAHIPDEIRALRDDDSVRAVLNLPHDNLLVAKEAMYLQTGHHKPLVAGFISRQTPVSPAKLSLLQTTLNPALLDDAQADVVILFRSWSDDLNAHVYASLGTPFYEDERLAAFRAPEANAPPTFHTAAQVPEQTAQRGDVYAYAPVRSWARLSGEFAADDDRAMSITVNQNRVHTVGARLISPLQQISLQLPVPLQPGYNTITLIPDPPCPRTTPRPNIVCRAITAQNVRLGEPLPPSLDAAVAFERGITLYSAAITPAGDVWLAWDVAETTTHDMVRFVHVINSESEQVAGVDDALGGIPAGTRHIDSLTFDLPAGETYRVYVGWYTYPDITRLNVLTDVDGAVNDWVLLGEIIAP